MRPESSAATRHVVSPRVELSLCQSAFEVRRTRISPLTGMPAVGAAEAERVAWLDFVGAENFDRRRWALPARIVGTVMKEHAWTLWR